MAIGLQGDGGAERPHHHFPPHRLAISRSCGGYCYRRRVRRLAAAGLRARLVLRETVLLRFFAADLRAGLVLRETALLRFFAAGLRALLALRETALLRFFAAGFFARPAALETAPLRASACAVPP